MNALKIFRGLRAGAMVLRQPADPRELDLSELVRLLEGLGLAFAAPTAAAGPAPSEAAAASSSAAAPQIVAATGAPSNSLSGPIESGSAGPEPEPPTVEDAGLVSAQLPEAVARQLGPQGPFGDRPAWEAGGPVYVVWCVPEASRDLAGVHLGRAAWVGLSQCIPGGKYRAQVDKLAKSEDFRAAADRYFREARRHKAPSTLRCFWWP